MAPPAVPLWCAALLRPGGAGAIAPFEPQAKPIYLILGAAWLCISFALAATDFQLDSSLLLPSIGLLAFGLSPFILRERGMPLAAGVAEACTLMMAVNLAGLIATLLLAATAAPFADDLLVRADAALFFGFSWPELIRMIQKQDGLLTVASFSYSTLSWQVPLLMGALYLANQGARCWQFLTAWTLCLTATALIFPLLPAVGGYLHFGIAPAEVPGVRVEAAWRHLEVLSSVRDGSLRLLNTRVLEGVVTFPSFHAAGAVLLAWGWRSLPALAVVGIPLNVAMFLSSIVIGGHYLVDIVAGTVLAIVSAIVAGRLTSLCRTTSLANLSLADEPSRG